MIALEKLTSDTSIGLAAAVSSITCKEELSVFCQRLQSEVKDNILKFFGENNSQNQENNNNIREIKEQLTQLQQMASQSS